MVGVNNLCVEFNIIHSVC